MFTDKREAAQEKQLVRLLGGYCGKPTVLDEADFIILAKGIKPDGGDGFSAVEHKGVYDLVACVLFSHRHLDQIRRMWAVYDEVTLLISEYIEPDDDGWAAVWRRGGLTPIIAPGTKDTTIAYTRLDKHLHTLQRLMGVRIIEAKSIRHAALRLIDLAEWWQTAPDHHSSWLGEYKPVSLTGRASLHRRIAADFDGIGLVRSDAVEARAKEVGASVREMVNWTEKEWMEVDGVGKVTAAKVGEELEGRLKK